jgi:hypothetical protein
MSRLIADPHAHIIQPRSPSPLRSRSPSTGAAGKRPGARRRGSIPRMTPRSPDKVGRSRGCCAPREHQARTRPLHALEDGAGLMFMAPAWDTFRKAVRRCESVTIAPTVGDAAITPEWIAETYASPIDGRAYVAEEGWTKSHPDRPVSPLRHRPMSRMVLLVESGSRCRSTCWPRISTRSRGILARIWGAPGVHRGVPSGRDPPRPAGSRDRTQR